MGAEVPYVPARAVARFSEVEKLGEPKSPAWLRKRVEKTLPKIDLPDLLCEVHSWTGFLDAFVHLGDGTTRMKDLLTSLVTLLATRSATRTWPGCPLSSSKNLNVLGRHGFTATQPAGGTLRPLRDPDAAGLDDDEDGAED